MLIILFTIANIPATIATLQAPYCSIISIIGFDVVVAESIVPTPADETDVIAGRVTLVRYSIALDIKMSISILQ